jgi:hypothetical protein
MKDSFNEANKPNKADTSHVVRHEEKIKLWFRSDRFIIIDHKWYFTTRENRDVGPFKSRDDAAHGLALFIECISNQNGDIEHAVSVATGGAWVVSLLR